MTQYGNENKSEGIVYINARRQEKSPPAEGKGTNKGPRVRCLELRLKSWHGYG